MLDLKGSTLKDLDDLDAEIRISQMKKQKTPDFITHKPDFSYFRAVLSKYSRYSKIIIIGNGGSINSFKAFYESLRHLARKEAIMLTTMEPDRIAEVLQNRKDDTLVMPISKSGTTVGQLESTLAFYNAGYRLLPVTGTEGILAAMVQKNKLDYIHHPDIGGRFAGRTAVGLVPAMFVGLDAEKINKGCLEMYKECAKIDIKKNPALRLSVALYLLEMKGYTEVFMPIYNTRLNGFAQIIIQLMHESFCKSGKGMTFYSAEAPESQHHTNQRFFGGRRNAVGLFVTAAQDDNKTRVNVPQEFRDIKIRDGTLADLDRIPYAKNLEFEFLGTYHDALNNKIPSIVLRLEKIDEKNVGRFLSFWQLVAWYSSLLRGVNPFDQPQVESSKDISFGMRKSYKR